MIDLQRPDVVAPLSLGQRLWRGVPKVPGADQIHQVRDLELPNEHRKILARGLFRLLDEQAALSVSTAQQAFLRGREISCANAAIAEAYYSAVDRRVLEWFLLLDCTMG